MRIAMMTNTYAPLVGGLENSIKTFSEEYRRRGHSVTVIAPDFDGTSSEEAGVVRVPSLKHVHGTDFSMHLTIPGFMDHVFKDLRPDIIHTHHPFLIGDTALRAAYRYSVPIVLTHHTMFEHNAHYFGGDSEWFKRFLVAVAAGYANLVDRVFAPSASVREYLRANGVHVPIDIVPTGIDVALFGSGDRAEARAALGISPSAFVVGYAGRLAPEKNLGFLTRAVAGVLRRHPDSRFLVAGGGPQEEMMRGILSEHGVAGQTVFAGVLKGGELASAYAAMDVFAFASKSETQGLVALEAMAAGSPVVALDAGGLRELVRDGVNGRLCPHEDEQGFAHALEGFLDGELRRGCSHEARRTAARYTSARCADRALASYRQVIREKRVARRFPGPRRPWKDIWREWSDELRADWDLAANVKRATEAASHGGPKEPARWRQMEVSSGFP